MPDNDPSNSRSEAQARLAAIIESSDDAIVSKTLDGVIQTWNMGAERIFGWKADEVIGKPITIIIPPDRLDEEPKILGRLRLGERVDHIETVRISKDGRLINVSITISPVRNEHGQIIGASKIARDITSQKEVLKELHAAKLAADDARRLAEQAREEAEAANRAKDHFLSVLSHELRTPLTPALGAMSMMEKDPTLPPHLAEHVSLVRRNVETEARLVDDLLDLTRIARGKVQLHFEAVDSHAVIRNVLMMFDHEIQEKGLESVTALRAKRFHIWVDPGRFQQMLLNLVSNAIKFTPEGGSIFLRTSNENGTIKIEVADTGIGVEPEILPQLFRPFEQGEQTGSRRFGGLGLGLSIVKSLVELHKASISATSDGKDKGATFVLRIETIDHTISQPHAAPIELDARKRFRVLLVEDHADTRVVLGKLLTEIGCIVTATSSVKDAITAAEHGEFDLLLSDIGLPDGTGLDVMKHVAKFNMTGIALSGFGQDEDLRKSHDAGFKTHLTKPVTLAALQEVINGIKPAPRG